MPQSFFHLHASAHISDVNNMGDGCGDTFCCCYMDNILSTSWSADQHVREAITELHRTEFTGVGVGAGTRFRKMLAPERVRCPDGEVYRDLLWCKFLSPWVAFQTWIAIWRGARPDGLNDLKVNLEDIFMEDKRIESHVAQYENKIVGKTQLNFGIVWLFSNSESDF